MVEPATFEIATDNVIVFGRTRLPRGTYHGAVEWWEIGLGGHVKRQLARAMVNVDRTCLEQLGEKIVSNLTSVDFDLAPYVKSGDVRILN